MVIEESRYMYIATVSALLGAICVGVSIGFSSPALETMLEIKKVDLANLNSTNNNSTINNSTNNISKDRIASDTDKSLIGSSVTFGALLGSLVGGTFSRRAGRKTALITYGIPFSIGCGVIYFAKSVLVVIIGRLITGFVTGMICSTVPSYIAEISTPKTRGFLGCGFQLFSTIGIFAMAFFGIFSTVTFNYFFNWRYLALFGVLPAILLSVSMLKMPESPVWLMEQYGRTSAEPEKALSILRTKNSDIQIELNEMEEQVDQAKSMTFTTDQLQRPDYWKPAVFGLALMFFQQFSGINIVMLFQTQILKDSRGSKDVSESERSNFAAIGTAIVCFTQVVATIGSAFVMDTWGRRKLLIISGVGHALTLSVLGIYFAFLPNLNSDDSMPTTIPPQKSPLPTFLPVVCLILYVIFFSLGYGPIPWLMIPEMTPLAIRGVLSSVASATSWSLAFVTTFTFNPLSSIFGVSTTFWFYALICVISCAFVFFFLPETKGKTFNEIQSEFLDTRTATSETAQAIQSPKGATEVKNVSGTSATEPQHEFLKETAV